MRRPYAMLVFCMGLIGMPCAESGVRDHTRPSVDSTSVSEAQSAELTLTLTEAAPRTVQTWVRTAGTLGADGRIVRAFVRPPDAELLAVGQRARGFPVTYRTQVRQGFVTKVSKGDGGSAVEVTLQDSKHYDDSRYLLEIVHEEGPLLTIPNVSIIEDGDEHAVYVQGAPGEYARRTIRIGRQGELYTQVLEGLAPGDQVVSIGSFFVDAEHKLKTGMVGGTMPGMNMSMPDMDHGSMPNMNQGAKPEADGGAMPGMNHDAPNPGGAMPNRAHGSTPSSDDGAAPSSDHGAMPNMNHGASTATEDR